MLCTIQYYFSTRHSAKLFLFRNGTKFQTSGFKIMLLYFDLGIDKQLGIMVVLDFIHTLGQRQKPQGFLKHRIFHDKLSLPSLTCNMNQFSQPLPKKFRFQLEKKSKDMAINSLCQKRNMKTHKLSVISCNMKQLESINYLNFKSCQ